MPVYYGGDLNDPDCTDPQDIDYEVWMDWHDFSEPDEDCGFSPEDGEAQFSPNDGEVQWPVTDSASGMGMGATAAPIRLQQDLWEESVSGADIDPRLVVDFLRFPCCQDPRGREDLQEPPRDSSEPPCDLEAMGSIESDIWSQDTVVVISDERVSSGMLCLLNFTCQRNYVQLAGVCGPYWMGMGHSRGTVWDPGGVGTTRLMLCCDCLCLIELFQNMLPCDHRQLWLLTLILKDIGYWRTIDWELAYSGRVGSPCNNTLSSCLDIRQIRGRWTDTMIGWGIGTLFLWCVGVL